MVSTKLSSQSNIKNTKGSNQTKIVSMEEYPLIGSTNRSTRPWSLNELILLENDYRKELIIKMKQKKDITTLDYSKFGLGKDWFHNISHFNILGTEKISSLVANDIINLLKWFITYQVVIKGVNIKYQIAI